MNKLFLTIFLWFCFALIGVGIVLLAVFAHMGISRQALYRLTLHDLVLFLIAGLIFCYFVSSQLTKPLQRLSQAAARIADGRLETRVDPSLLRRRDEIAGLAANFNLMAGRIEALVGGQKRLLADVSHELRSPLARLIVALSLVKKGPPEETAANLERIALEANRLDAMIGQLLALTRLDSGVDGGAPEQFDLVELVQEVAADADFEAKARGRSVSVEAPAACNCQGLPEQLRSAIENVVRNSVRHTAEGSSVDVTVQCNPREAVVRIRDHGPGVPEALLSEIFQPFRRVPGDATEGAGLGLAIAARAVALNCGSIKARNAPGGGLTVEIQLPLQERLGGNTASA